MLELWLDVDATQYPRSRLDAIMILFWFCGLCRVYVSGPFRFLATGLPLSKVTIFWGAHVRPLRWKPGGSERT